MRVAYFPKIFLKETSMHTSQALRWSSGAAGGRLQLRLHPSRHLIADLRCLWRHSLLFCPKSAIHSMFIAMHFYSEYINIMNNDILSCTCKSTFLSLSYYTSLLQHSSWTVPWVDAHPDEVAASRSNPPAPAKYDRCLSEISYKSGSTPLH